MVNWVRGRTKKAWWLIVFFASPEMKAFSAVSWLRQSESWKWNSRIPVSYLTETSPDIDWKSCGASRAMRCWNIYIGAECRGSTVVTANQMLTHMIPVSSDTYISCIHLWDSIPNLPENEASLIGQSNLLWAKNETWEFRRSQESTVLIDDSQIIPIQLAKYRSITV